MINLAYPDHSGFDTKIYNNWLEFYPDVQELVPEKGEAPVTKGLPVHITVYKDADHAYYMFTRQSISGILLLLNNIPIQ